MSEYTDEFEAEGPEQRFPQIFAEVRSVLEGAYKAHTFEQQLKDFLTQAENELKQLQKRLGQLMQTLRRQQTENYSDQVENTITKIIDLQRDTNEYSTKKNTDSELYPDLRSKKVAVVNLCKKIQSFLDENAHFTSQS